MLFFFIVWLLFRDFLAFWQSLFVLTNDFATNPTPIPRLFTRLDHILEGFPTTDALLGTALHPTGDLGPELYTVLISAICYLLLFELLV